MHMALHVAFRQACSWGCYRHEISSSLIHPWCHICRIIICSTPVTTPCKVSRAAACAAHAIINDLTTHQAVLTVTVIVPVYPGHLALASFWVHAGNASGAPVTQPAIVDWHGLNCYVGCVGQILTGLVSDRWVCPHSHGLRVTTAAAAAYRVHGRPCY